MSADVERSSPSPDAQMLVAYLDAQRRHVLRALDGLDDEALRRPVLPSGWSCLGLVQHLARDVERFWFQAVVAGDASVVEALDAAGDAWQVAPDVPAVQVLDEYRQEAARANEVLARTDLDGDPGWWSDELFGGGRVENVRDVVLHVIVETATHAGHVDAVRELIDGTQSLVLT